ncbi:hypothetical protein [Legionella worsleiensis]|uniref:Serine/threonine protein kinase n=1 Tax=Legionella worsleiensis TaxID=45076 RepID=A0A0W1A9F8_9GAMM|nr:hypothetical protein [Legionella worsleiensis]KTD77994.1 serine/threonine protein kinase [Legionella worsleiensis]STY31527.1 serine/threonine protein kinase [Legionella worsleiensis]
MAFHNNQFVKDFKDKPDDIEFTQDLSLSDTGAQSSKNQLFEISETDDVTKLPIIKSFAKGALPKDKMKKFQKAVNKLITQFNASEQLAEKEHILRQIQEIIKEVDCKYPPNLIARSKGYYAVQRWLFEEIKKQFKRLGVESLLPTHSISSPLTHIVANMSPSKAEDLLAILAVGNQQQLLTKLNSLYRSNDSSDEAVLFREFLSSHAITFLGGGNSKNFLVTRMADQSTWVLKVDNRLNLPKNIEVHLRQRLSKHFAPVHVERQLTYTDPDEGRQSRTLLVTEYYRNSDLSSYRKKLSSDVDIVDSACELFSQMAHVMQRIQEQRCFFSDAKYTNWLLGDDGTLLIADTKSFLFANSAGFYDRLLKENEYSQKVLLSPFFTPPEYDRNDIDKEKIEVEKAHAYLLGKNLYAFLTGVSDGTVKDSQLNFNYEVFTTEKGKKLKQLIKNLIQQFPAQRTSLAQAGSMLLDMTRDEVFEELESLKFGAKDEKMDEYILAEKARLFTLQNDPQQQFLILNELKKTIKALKEDEAANEIRTIVANFRSQAGVFTVGMNAKANKIESAMANIPIKDRINLNASLRSLLLKTPQSSPHSTPFFKDLLQALATHRHFGKRGTVYFKPGTEEINAEKAAASYKNFQLKFFDKSPVVGNNDAEPVNTREDSSTPKNK